MNLSQFNDTETEKRYGSQIYNIQTMIGSGTPDDLFCARTILKSMLRTEYLYRYVGNSTNAATEYALIDELVKDVNLRVGGGANTITNDLIVKTNASIGDEGIDESDGDDGVIRERSDYGDSSEDIGEPPENSEDIEEEEEEDDYGEQEGEEEIDSDISDEDEK